MSRATVMLTSAGGALVPQAIRQMRASERHDFRIIAVDAAERPVARALADRFHVVPLATAPGYVEHMARLCAEEKVDILLPWSDEEALSLAARREEIEIGGRKLACAPLETLRLMSDKLKSLQALANAGLPVPEFDLAETAEDLGRAIAAWQARGIGFVVKPLRSRGGRDVLVVEPGRKGVLSLPGHRELYLGPEDLAPHLERDPANLPVLVMERLVPPAWDIDVLTWQGEMLRCAPRRRSNPSGIPFEGSMLDPMPELQQIAERVTKALKLSWLYDYDLMCGQDGKPRLMELNPRPSGSLAAVVALGVPVFDDLVSLALGESLPAQIEPRWGATVLNSVALEIVS